MKRCSSGETSELIRTIAAQANSPSDLPQVFRFYCVGFVDVDSGIDLFCQMRADKWCRRATMFFAYDIWHRTTPIGSPKACGIGAYFVISLHTKARQRKARNSPVECWMLLYGMPGWARERARKSVAVKLVWQTQFLVPSSGQKPGPLGHHLYPGLDKSVHYLVWRVVFGICPLVKRAVHVEERRSL